MALVLEAPIIANRLTLGSGSCADLTPAQLQANTASTHTHPLYMLVALSRVEDEDLRDFVEHLSYRYRGSPNQWRIYDFFGARRGELTAMDLQIVLMSNGLLKLTRARRPNTSFEESDE